MSKRVASQLFVALLFLVLVPLCAHFMFSWMGFTPTDEGFTLAYSRRILDGQVPHRDFIIIRPFVSPLIHVPFVWLGGASTFWLSRLFVWFQLASISLLWVLIIDRLTQRSLKGIQLFSIALLCFAVTTHIKHVTAWHTIDGLFFAAIAFTCTITKSPRTKMIGYLFIGVAPLCKQSFVFLIPLSLLILNDWRRVRYWIAALSPSFAYAIYLVAERAFAPAVVQLTAQTSLLQVGLVRYIVMLAPVWAILGYATRKIFAHPRFDQRTRTSITLLVFYFGPVAGTAISLWYGVLIFTSFLLFGLLLGMTIALHLNRNEEELRGLITSAWLVLSSAWCASLSGGYNSPVLMSGPILVVLLVFVLRRFRNPRWLQYSTVAAAVIIVVSFGVARTKYIYRDQNADRLTKSLDGVLPGGRHIYTNENTFQFMMDLDHAVELAEHENKLFAILPDVAAYWVKAPQQNPLPAVWPHAEELTKPALLNHYIQAMEERRSDTTFIVQKVDATQLANGFAPLPSNDYYPVVRYARQNFTKIQETKYFELYK